MSALWGMHAEAITAPGDGLGPALLLTIGPRLKAQYLFNVPEGFSRFVLEHKLRPGLGLRAVFVSDLMSASGLPGLIMRLRGEGHGSFELFGPLGAIPFVSSLRHFVHWKHPAVLVTEQQRPEGVERNGMPGTGTLDDHEGGKGLLVSEVDVELAPDDDAINPAGNVFVVKETPLLKESEAQRIADASKGRYWKVSNPASLHPVTGKPVAWKVITPPSPLLMALPRSSLTRRGAFATKHLWVTPHSDEERWPAGDYTIQSEGGGGLGAWTAQNRNCGPGSDPILYLSFGATHIVRTEDFPCMPC